MSLYVRDPLQRMVLEFHVATDSTVGDTPALRDVPLRMDLLYEELSELENASSNIAITRHGVVENADPDIKAAIKELCDLLYVALGTAVAWGIDIVPFFEEVHRSNMSKLPFTKNAAGKVRKGPNYAPPDFGGLLG